MKPDSDPDGVVLPVENGAAEAAIRVVHFPNPADALAAEHAVIDGFRDPAKQFHVGFWTTEQCLVAPRSLLAKPNVASAQQTSAESGWPVYFRRTGGDLTPQGAGIVNVVVAFAPGPSERPSIDGVYQMFCDPLLRLVRDYAADVRTGFVADCFCDGAYNIVVAGLKVAGTAQRWTRVRSAGTRQIVFAHALLLVDAPLSKGVAAINRLYQDCGIEKRVLPEVHTNLRFVVSSERTPPDCQQIAGRLHELYRDELSALTQ